MFHNYNNIQNNKNNQIFLVKFRSGLNEIPIFTYPEEKISELIKKYRNKSGDNDCTKRFVFGAKQLTDYKTCAEEGLSDNFTIWVIPTGNVKGGGVPRTKKEINIKFIKLSKNILYRNIRIEIIGLLKLCLLKELSNKISEDKLKKLPEFIYYILKILSNGYIEDTDAKQNIKDVLEKMKGSNIVNFSNYVDEIIDSNQLEKIINLVNREYIKDISDKKYLLGRYYKYIKKFNKEFKKSLKNSIFEFSVISIVIIERENLEIFEEERKKCPNRITRILYHGTGIEPISNILTSVYIKSESSCQHGVGVYFSDLLDYSWFYGGKNNRANLNKIPKINDSFTTIVNYIYYDKTGYKKVNNSLRTPGKNQINFAYAGAMTETIEKIDNSKFLGNEYVINDLNQICPFMSMKLKRVEYCVIWRDNNFSSKPVYNNYFDQTFKSFLKERMKYINQNAKYNIYPCETSEEALDLLKRKKYNKILLISNVGDDLGGKKFINNARVILGNNVITLFLAYNIAHLDWIKNYKNALFSNEPKFYEEYLQCFDEEDEYDIKNKIKSLIEKMEKHYNVKFNFDDTYLNYPHFKTDGQFSDLEF